MPFNRLTLEDGLPNPSVLDIIQDEQGFMWFGTLGGIVRYDGYAMQVYRPSVGKADTLPVRNLPVLCKGRSGDIWLGYGWGECRLFRYDPGTDRFQHFLYDTLAKKSLIPLDDAVSSLLEDRKGRLWVGTYGIGLFVVEGEQFQQYSPQLPPPYTFPSTDVLGPMAEDEAGNIWMPTLEGLCKWEEATGTFRLFRFSEKKEQRANECWSVCFVPPATIWVGSSYEGLVRFDVNRESFKKYPIPPPTVSGEQYVRSLAVLKDGKIALAVGAVGILQAPFIPLFDPVKEQWSGLKWREDRSRNETIMNEVCVDYAGNLWAGAWQKGIFQYDPNKGRFRRWNPYLPQSAVLVHPKPKSFFEDSQGEIWIGTSSLGLFEWDIGSSMYRRYAMPPKPIQPGEEAAVSSIQQGPSGSLWLGASRQGIQFFPETRQAISMPFSWKGVKINNTVLWETSGGKRWLTAWGFGFCELQEGPGGLGIRKCYTEKDSIWQIGAIMTLEEGPQGRIWLGINQNGLLIFDPSSGSFERYIPEYGVWDIHFGRNGLAWLATHSSGLKGFDPNSKQLIHLDAETNAALGLVQGILEDRQGMLWMLNARGLVQFDPFQKRILRRISAANWREEAESGYAMNIPSLKTRNGGMVYGELSGAVYFHPDSLLLDTLPPKLAFTGFQLFNQPVAPGPDGPLDSHISRAKAIRLKHWQNDISLQFSALYFKNPEEYQYRYRMAPWDNGWINIGSRREVFFTALAPGKYTLWVQAANADGAWNEEGIRLEVVVLRPWWKTYLAFTAYALVLLAGFYSAYRFLLGRRLQEAENLRLLELDAFKNRVFTNITHEFRTPLTIILGVANQLKYKVEQLFRPELKNIEDQGNRLLRLVNQMLDLARLESGRLSLELVQSDVFFFLRYLVDSFRSLAEEKKLALQLSTAEGPFFMDFAPEHLEQVIVNLLSNAIKFTPAGGTISVRAQAMDSGTFRIEVADTGMGIPPEMLERVFERFLSLPQAPRRGGGPGNLEGARREVGFGTGIGLALCRELVHLMGGEITVTSEPGHGACFTVELPITQNAHLKAMPLRPDTGKEEFLSGEALSAAAEPADSLPLVLLIEDHPALRAYVRGCLEGHFRVEEAENGQQGLEKALELTPELVISDVMMPEMDGFEVCRRLKTDIRASHIPVILLTARADAPSRLEGLQHGADAYLTKPFLAAELKLIAHKQIELRQRLQAYYQSLISGEAPDSVEGEQPEEAAFIIQVREYLLQHLDDATLNVTALADTLAMSRSQLHRKITGLAGFTPVDLIRNVRLGEAKKMLKATDLQVAEIAYQCGYTDPGFFTRVFREQFGMTPTEYRRGKGG
ncbi:MAG: response regulator [Phaeodactylibacter sp.]|nr:response regulator [Phaeodactylibacter sp.]MCB9304046.1 response regulator [Lewinellaceae bacterium]